MEDLAQKLADAAVQAIATQCPVSTGDRAREVAAHAIRQSLATHGGEAVAPFAYGVAGGRVWGDSVYIDRKTAEVRAETRHDGSVVFPLYPHPAPTLQASEREERLREALTQMLEIHGVTQRYADTHIEIPQSWVDSSEMARKALAAQEKK